MYSTYINFSNLRMAEAWLKDGFLSPIILTLKSLKRNLSY